VSSESPTAPRLHVDESGPADGESVLLLHGGSAAGVIWAPQRLVLERDFHVLVPDLPGFGASSDLLWAGPAETADLVAESIRDRAADGSAHVVGFSLGGLVALALVARHPDLVRSVAFLSATPRGIGSVLRRISTDQVHFWRALAGLSSARKALRLPRSLLDTIVDLGLGVDPVAAKRVLDDSVRGTPELLPRLTDFDRPLLAIAGERESRTVRSTLADYARAERAELRLAPRGLHLWNLQSPVLLTETLGQWLSDARPHPDLLPVPRGLARRAARIARAARAARAARGERTAKVAGRDLSTSAHASVEQPEEAP